MQPIHCRLCGDSISTRAQLADALNELSDHVREKHPDEWPLPKYDRDMTEFGTEVYH